MHASLARRQLLKGGASLLAAAWAAPVLAEPTLDDLRRVLGDKVPAPLRSVLPREAVGAAGIVAELLKLEQQARLQRLPPSPLAFGKDAPPIDPERLYEQVMPRLVALIDRAGQISPGLAEQAGGLLARLHLTQYDPPDAWFGDGAAPPAWLSLESAGRFNLEPAPVRPLRLADPPESPDPSVSLKVPQTGLPAAILGSAAAPGPVSTSLKFADLAQEYAQWFEAARIRPEHQESVDWHLALMRSARPRYEAVGERAGVPWYFIAAVHGLEASFNFRAHLHNGDFPLSRRTHQVPAGRPSTWLPPSDWESSAADALRIMGFTGQDDWSLPRLLYRLEAYNGFGYRRAGRVTPYLWSFSSLYDRGKFVADGKFDPRARSQQCGAGVMLKALGMAESILFN